MELGQRVVNEAHRLIDEGRLSDAISLLEHITIEGLNTLGMLYSSHTYNRAKAVRCLETAIDLDPGNWITNSNLGHVLNGYEDFGKAERVSNKAVNLCNQEVYNPVFNYAVILNNLKRPEDAANMYRKAIELHDIPMNHYNLACCLLLQGRFEEGWKEYESRLRAYDKTITFQDRFTMPHWDGDKKKLKGKTVAIYSEQGIGDLFHFCRFIPQILAMKPKKIYLEAQKDAAEIIQKAMPKVEVTPVVMTTTPPRRKPI